MKKGHLTPHKIAKIHKRAKRIRKAKNIKKNKRKGGRIIIGDREFRTDKKGQRELQKYLAEQRKSQPAPAAGTPAPSLHRSWWKRLFDRIRMWYNKSR